LDYVSPVHSVSFETPKRSGARRRPCTDGCVVRRSRSSAAAASSAQSLRTQSFGPPPLLVCHSASTSTVPPETR
jgi:hypothetical protein